MKDFDTVFEQALNDRMTTRLRVTQLGGSTRRIGGKEWQWFCLCFSGEGCDCKNPILVLLEDILDRFGTGERNEDGDEIIEIVVPREANVLVQRVAKLPVAAAARVAASGCGKEDRDPVPGVAYWLSFGDIKDALVDAFEWGFEKGTALDEAFDGAISDYLAEKIEEIVEGLKGKQK